MKNKFFTVLLFSIVLLTLTSTSILAANMTKDQLLEVQKELKEESFYDGQIDGLYGPLTAKAIKNYQKENDLKVDARNIEDNYLLITKNNKDKSGGYIEMKLGVETLNEMKLTNNEYDMNETRDLNVGFSITGEYKYPVTDTQLVVGGGINQQINRSFKKSNEIKMNFTSLYSIGQYDIKNTPVYLFGKLGYNFINIDEEYFDDGVKPEINGGMYYGLGSGFTFGENDQFLIEGVYSVNNGEIVYKVPDHTIINKLKCSTLQISVGMRF